MAELNKLLNIVPCNCRSCEGASYAIAHITEEAWLRGVFATELRCTDAERVPVWNALSDEDHIFVNGFGHGNAGIYTGDSETMIFDTNHCDILRDRIVYLLSCLTAKALGPAIIATGGIAYGGYDISWTWVVNDVNKDPYLDYYAEGFYRSSNEFPIALVQGDAVFRARERCIAEYNRWLNIWETERSGDAYAAIVIKWLLVDRDGLVVLGNMDATIIAAGVPTIMAVDVEPPPFVDSEAPFIFAGRLVERETGAPLAGRTVYVNVDEVRVATVVTGTDGDWAFEATLAIGVHGIYVGFQGDEDYAPGYTRIYTVEAGFTRMTVTVSPPSSADPGQTFPFSGVLISGTNVGIPNKPINLLMDHTQVATTTDSDGNWHFNVTIPAIGHYILYAEFPGDDEYSGAWTDTYFVATGELPYFGYAGEHSRVSINPVGNISGTVFRAMEDGFAESITFYSQHSWFANRMRCAIYDWGTKRLIAETVEGRFLAGRVWSWETFVFSPTKPQLIGGKEYLLVVWADTACAAYYYKPGDFDYQFQQMLPADYNGFPEVWEPYTGVHSLKGLIYCSYQSAAPGEYTLAISATVGGTTEPAPGSYNHPEGSTVGVTAYPDPGYLFDHWTLDGIVHMENPIDVFMNMNHVLQAVFVKEPVPTYILTIETVGQGRTVPAPGQHFYEAGTVVSVSAIPDAGWAFDYWEGDISSTANPIDLTITDDMLIRAVFTEVVVPPEEHAVTISVVGQGTTDPAPGTYSVLDGAIFSITAIPTEGWLFDHWEGDMSGTMNPVDIEVLQDISVVAVFSEAPPKPRWVWPVVGAALIGIIVVATRGERKK